MIIVSMWLFFYIFYFRYALPFEVFGQLPLIYNFAKIIVIMWRFNAPGYLVHGEILYMVLFFFRLGFVYVIRYRFHLTGKMKFNSYLV